MADLCRSGSRNNLRPRANLLPENTTYGYYGQPFYPQPIPLQTSAAQKPTVARYEPTSSSRTDELRYVCPPVLFALKAKANKRKNPSAEPEAQTRTKRCQKEPEKFEYYPHHWTACTPVGFDYNYSRISEAVSLRKWNEEHAAELRTALEHVVYVRTSRSWHRHQRGLREKKIQLLEHKQRQEQPQYGQD